MNIYDNKGISLLTLIITIVIMILLTYFAVFSSQNTVPEARLAAEFTSIGQVRDACQNALTLIELNSNEEDEYDYFGKNVKEQFSEAVVDDYASRCGLASSADLGTRTYYIGPDNDDSTRLRLSKLELSTVKSSYLCDLDNDKYYLIDGVSGRENDSGERKTLYEYKEIERGYEVLTNYD